MTAGVRSKCVWWQHLHSGAVFRCSRRDSQPMSVADILAETAPRSAAAHPVLSPACQSTVNRRALQPTVLHQRGMAVRTNSSAAFRKLLFDLAIFLLFLLSAQQRAHASIALLMEEPYGTFGAVNPTGHAAVYLNHVCADSPTVLRPCRAGEFGVVISRYHKVDGLDWIAIPLVGYLYAVDSPADIPATADEKQVATLRDAYRLEHLLSLAPDTRKGGSPKGEWTELVGSSYDRTIHGFQIDSTLDQDQRFIAIFNDRKNVGHFNLLFHNCADFSRVVLDTYLPHAIHRNFIADVGLMTPKQVARSLVTYGKRYPQLHMTAFVIPQVPGGIPRSHPVDGVAESLVKSKKYLLPLTVFAPEVTGGVVVAYLIDGRLKLPKGTPVFDIGDEESTGQPTSAAAVPQLPGSTPDLISAPVTPATPPATRPPQLLAPVTPSAKSPSAS
jgi:hypothetical protein